MGYRFNRALILAPILGVGALWQGIRNYNGGYTAFGLFGIVMGTLLIVGFLFALRRVFRR